MGREIDDIIESLPKGRRDKINARAQRLAVEMISEADSLAAIRQLSGVTQKQLGHLLGIKQNAVSQMESRTDVYLSTLRNVVAALGYELEVALRKPDGRRVPLPRFRPWSGEAAPAKTSVTAAAPAPTRKRSSARNAAAAA